MISKRINYALLWFGAAISIAEIITGTFFAPLGVVKGLMAIFIGHLIGGLLLFLTAYMGASVHQTSMKSVIYSFGDKGSKLFALFNVIQLVGWTSVMIYDSGITMQAIINIDAFWWKLLVGGLVIIWLIPNKEHFKYLNTIAITCLLLLCVYLSVKVAMTPHTIHAISGNMSFSLAVEMAISMPISWLPVVADYLQDSDQPLKDSTISTLAYTIASIWMYGIGLFIALYTKEYTITNILKSLGLPVIALIIILLSSVTTTYLDAYSSGESFVMLIKNKKAKIISIAFTIMATIIAIGFPIYNLTPFLTFIGSIFVPMIAIMMVDYYLFKQPGDAKSSLIIWFIGFIVYQVTTKYQVVLGSTITSLLVVSGLVIVVRKYQQVKQSKNTIK